MPASLVIRGGMVVDGTGAAPRRADVAADGDRIVAVGEIGEQLDARLPDARILDATGLAVTPGFVNILSHAWGSLQLEPRGPSDLLQGVTTEVFGEAFSLGPSSAELTKAEEAFGLRHGQRVGFPRLADGLDHLAKSGIAPNVASFIGGHNLRVLGAGFSDERLSPEALDRLRGIVDEEMADGALGIGTALIYPPGCFADTDELVALCEVVGRHNGLYISHLRSEGDHFLECLDELVEIGRRAEVRTEVYHLKAAGRENWPKMKLAIERIEAARERGQPVGANMYPYTAGGTALSASIPPPYHVGGPDALAGRLADPAERARMAADIRRPSADWENLFLAAGGGAGILLLAAGGRGGELVGRRLDEIARDRGQDEADALLDLVALDPTIGTAYFIIDEDNVELGLAQPWVSVGSDAEAPAAEAPWTDQPTHPRSYGTFARVLGHYSRERGLFGLAEAVRKMTSLPADTLGLAGRGRVAVGAAADLVVLDPGQVIDRATYEDSHRYAAGVQHVVVNGEAVVVGGELTGALPGRRLRRGR